MTTTTTDNEKRSSEDAVEALAKKRSKQEDGCNNGSITSHHGGTSPLSVLSSTTTARNVVVQSLSLSDQHATLLITQNNKSDDDISSLGNDKDISGTNTTAVKSLLKLTLVPFHKAILGSNPVLSVQDSHPPERNLLPTNNDASANIVSFLKGYDFKLKSESGAEYSYYCATPSKSVATGDPPMKDMETNEASKTNAFQFGAFDVELISPATHRQISRAMPSLGSTLIHETPQVYQAVVQPYIQSIVDGGSLGWINNIIQVKKEKERLLVNTDQFIINIDTKWRTHPPPLTTPREEWYAHESVQDLYCLGIVKQNGIASMRDLRGEHVPMLKDIQQQGFDAIESIYGVKADQIKCFVHYQPQFYHFHVHFTRLENEIGSTVEKGHLVSDIVQNLEMDSDFFQKRTIVYKLKKGVPLQNLIENHLNAAIA
jgi:m7GpppX diphosphatase